MGNSPTGDHPNFLTRHCEPARTLVWQSVFFAVQSTAPLSAAGVTDYHGPKGPRNDVFFVDAMLFSLVDKCLFDGYNNPMIFLMR